MLRKINPHRNASLTRSHRLASINTLIADGWDHFHRFSPKIESVVPEILSQLYLDTLHQRIYKGSEKGPSSIDTRFSHQTALKIYSLSYYMKGPATTRQPRGYFILLFLLNDKGIAK